MTTEPTVDGLTPDQLADVRQLLVRLGGLRHVSAGPVTVLDLDGGELGEATLTDSGWVFVPAQQDNQGEP